MKNPKLRNPIRFVDLLIMLDKGLSIKAEGRVSGAPVDLMQLAETPEGMRYLYTQYVTHIEVSREGDDNVLVILCSDTVELIHIPA